ncbi:MAG: heme-binding protein [Acholeplasma sp.]|nr:MAG: heme-binding protein [Acholeplasma sp.]
MKWSNSLLKQWMRCNLYSWKEYLSMALYETIKYKVIEEEGSCEIREYEDILLASTKTKMNSSMDSGFGNVFNYISGNNKERQKISMTTPVVSYEEQDRLVTGFYVPS